MNKRCMGCMNEYSEEFEICPYCGFIENSEPESPLHMEPGTYLADRYIVGRVVGYGGFGVTYIGWDAKLEQKVAIKEYLPSEFSTRAPGHSKLTIYSGDKAEQFSKGLNQFVDEAKRLAKFQNTTGIVKVFDSFEENQTAYIIMEYLDGETLAAKLKRDGVMAADDAIALLMPIMESLETVHEEGILHRDIAPDNIFITKDGDAKLIDFGAARYATTGYSMSLTVLIKPGFSPEEQYRTKGDQGPHTDVYSMAATLYKTITGKTPPDSLKRRVEFEKSNKDILFPLHKFAKEIPESTENAIMNALNVRIEDRTPTMAAFIGELKSDNVKRVGNKIRRIDLLRWPLWAKISVPLVALALIVTGVLFALGIIGFDSNLKNETEIPEGMTRIPNVVNTELHSAEDKLKELDLKIYVEGQEYSNDIPMNFIKSQTPGGGAVVDKMTNINVHISAGIDGEVVPDLYGLPLEDAKVQLETLGFVCETNEDFDATIAAGCVMKQSVEAGKEAAKGSTIVLTVSKGRDPSKEYPAKEVKVINFVGMTYNDAIKSAAKAELVIKVSEKKYSDSVPENTVMAQSVPADSVITNDKVIELTVSLGKKTVVVPYVIGATEANAKAMLGEKELKVTVEYKNSDSFAAGLVMSQSVAAKKEVTPGTEVKITVSKGAASFAVPNVVGKSEASAKSTLNAKGLKVSVTYAKNSSVAEGNVISQNPSSGNVKSGDTVTITVSSGKPIVTVTFNANGGNVDVTNSTVLHTGTYGSLPTPKRDYYTFNGWYTQSSGGSQITSGTTVSNSNNHTLYAHWTENEWSGWVDANSSIPSGAKTVDTRTVYRYRDKSTTSNTTGTTPSGYTYSHKEENGGSYSYGSWSGWSTTSVSSSNTKDVETKTQYGYGRYTHSCGHGSTALNSCSCGNVGRFEEQWLDSPLTMTSSAVSGNSKIKQYGTWFVVTDYRTTYNYYNYGGTRTMYRSRTKTWNPAYKYHYYKWGSWSSYSTTVYTASSTREVESKQQIRYQEK